MSQSTSVDPGVLKAAAAMLRYVDQQPATDPLRRAATLRHLHALARIAVRAVQPRPRDVEVTNRRSDDVAGVSLTDMERRVLELLPSELETEGIAECLGLTKGQVQRLQKSLHRALGSSSRHRSVAVGLELGLLALDGGVWRAVRASDGLSGVGAGESLPVAPVGLQGASEAVAS